MYLLRVVLVLVAVSNLIPPASAAASERLCDSSHEDCRTPLINLIKAETVGIDVAFWFMEDARYSAALIDRFNAGVPVRVIMDTEANANYPDNIPVLAALKNAGIPMLQKTSGGIVHWKTMIFAGQNVIQFSGANYSPHAFVPTTNYIDYIDEVIYFTDDPALVNSFKTKYDEVWITTTGYTAYANITSTRTRHYPIFSINSALNFPPYNNFADRSVKAYNAETVGIDSLMFRITDRRHTDALIAARQRGVPVRLITEPDQYRDPARMWHSWNVDRLYMAGVKIRMRSHTGGENAMHQKTTLLRGQQVTIFGSSNWTSPSATSQLEHNIFTTKPWFYQFMSDLFERKWTNSAGFNETQPFVPLPPDAPVYVSPANASAAQPLTVTLKWHAGYWAHKYDIYLGTTPDPPLLIANQELGPSETPTDYITFTVTGLTEGTTYYWKVVSKTMAEAPKSGAIWNFRTDGAGQAAGDGDVVLYAAKAPARTGRWAVVADTTAAGGARMATTDAGVKLTASANPADYFEMTFTASAGVPYRLWLRGKAQNDTWASDSAYAQFNDSVTGSGAETFRIGTTSATTVTLEDCTGCGVLGWGWNDNGYGTGVLGPEIFFATSGEHTIRVQMREDGFSIDQIVLSRSAYLSSAPGATKNDGTILMESGGTVGSAGGGAPTGDNPDPDATDVVLHAASATLAGSWQIVADSEAASGVAAVLPDAARAKVTAAAANPDSYFDVTFHAYANTPYHLWIRGRALNNASTNDSVHVQFTDSVDANYVPAWRIGSASGLEVNLEDCSGCGNAGWGWEDNGWGTPTTLGSDVRFPTTGQRTIRIQNREDGFYIDQIVLSPTTYRTSAPGANKNDTTILPPSP